MQHGMGLNNTKKNDNDSLKFQRLTAVLYHNIN